MPLPSLSEILLDLPLYTPLQLETADSGTLEEWGIDTFQLDGYCTHCEDRTIFYDSRLHRFRPEQPLGNRSFTMNIHCGRNKTHTVTFHFVITKRTLMKVGQYPSHADMSNPELKKYRKALGPERAAELHRAIGLAANGVGIGSYAYLRRIFETLLADHRKAVEDADGAIAGYDGMRIEEKITALKSVLPEALVRNRSVYGILSKGIHELSEAECLVIFPVVKDAIVMILEQDRVNKERREQEAALQKRLDAVANQIKRAQSGGDLLN
ncbi:short-chain dehydrogenase [Novosphingobium sp. Chol11]|uniref:short-chain dehydrogenase n=1 Tax=Novosphingobium sp. Chol11 TaxID=1385763 RepID=UPI00114434F9|nr:short-chain dehydrogenase [Novosphingobium sp. Chol11]